VTVLHRVAEMIGAEEAGSRRVREVCPPGSMATLRLPPVVSTEAMLSASPSTSVSLASTKMLIGVRRTCSPNHRGRPWIIDRCHIQMLLKPSRAASAPWIV